MQAVGKPLFFTKGWRLSIFLFKTWLSERFKSIFSTERRDPPHKMKCRKFPWTFSTVWLMQEFTLFEPLLDEIPAKYIKFADFCFQSIGMSEIDAVFRLLENPCFYERVEMSI
ncbi:hypothetical protein, partial [Paenibacillus dendritiformis]|uniref:hypothetical protein n=1 Tax=Paenibacillus dendritiformis TaxID=130049 RepID=UPI00387E042E